MKQTAREVSFHLFARVLYDTFHNKGVKSASYLCEKSTFHNSIVKNVFPTVQQKRKFQTVTPTYLHDDIVELQP